MTIGGQQAFFFKAGVSPTSNYKKSATKKIKNRVKLNKHFCRKRD
jgi:hypothetical protein